MPKNILVIGGSRGIGAATVRLALSGGHSVRVLARSAAQISVDEGRSERFSGDATDPSAVRPAMEGVDAVVMALGVTHRAMMAPIRLFSQATRVLLDTLNGRDVRIIAVTGFGAGQCAEAINPLHRIPFRMALGRAYDDKNEQERLIESSDTRWTIVRPGVLHNGVASGTYRVLIERDSWQNGLIARADVADFIVRCLDDDSTIGQSPVLIGNTGVERVASALSLLPFGARRFRVSQKTPRPQLPLH